MTTWTSDELTTIGGAEELQIGHCEAMAREQAQ